MTAHAYTHVQTAHKSRPLIRMHQKGSDRVSMMTAHFFFTLEDEALLIHFIDSGKGGLPSHLVGVRDIAPLSLASVLRRASCIDTDSTLQHCSSLHFTTHHLIHFESQSIVDHGHDHHQQPNFHYIRRHLGPWYYAQPSTDYCSRHCSRSRHRHTGGSSYRAEALG